MESGVSWGDWMYFDIESVHIFIVYYPQHIL